MEKDGVNALVLGVGQKNRAHLLKKPEVGKFLKARVPPKKHIRQFKVSPENFLPVGYMLSPLHYKIGQRVDVKGTSKGKGTEGVMRRWNFAG